jgi:hypothetical protein
MPMAVEEAGRFSLLHHFGPCLFTEARAVFILIIGIPLARKLHSVQFPADLSCKILRSGLLEIPVD